LRYLAQHHHVHLVSFVRSPFEEQSARSLSEFCSGVTTVPLHRSRLADMGYLLRSLVNGQPFLIERDGSRAMRKAIEQLVARENFDVVHADQLSMGQFAIDLPVPIRVLDEHNAVWTIVRRAAAYESSFTRRLVAEIEWRKLRSYEGRVVREVDHVTVVSDADRQALEMAAGAPIRATIVPITVDIEALRFAPATSAAPRILSVATMFYPPNAEGVSWFAREVFPIVRAAVPAAEFTIVGSRPPKNVLALADSVEGISVTGYVEDLDPLVQESTLLVVPVHSGSGMRVKILEALARGLPIVSTSVGAEGIDVVAGEHLLVADEPADFASAVIHLLRDSASAGRLARRGRELVEQRYDWRTGLSALESVYPSETIAHA
jgi:polysaccharide biosynthesis protein PslH